MGVDLGVEGAGGVDEEVVVGEDDDGVLLMALFVVHSQHALICY